MKFIVRNILFLFNLIFIIGLGLGYLSPYVDPQLFWMIGFFGLSFKAWVLANAVLLFFWMGLGKRLWVYNLAILLLGYQFILRDIQFGGSSLSTNKRAEFRTLFFNTQVLQVYNNGNTAGELDEFLAQYPVDVAVFVEWLNKKGEINSQRYPYQQFVRLESGKNIYDYGIMMASKHKILHWERVDYGHTSDNMTAWFDVEIEDEVVRIIATHMQSNSLGASDYHKFLDLEFDEDYKNHARRTISTLKRALKRRSIQSNRISQIAEESPYPVIIMGDFNDTPQSYAYQQLKDGRKDAFVECGSGVGTTFLKPFPLLRIDFILHDKDFDCKSYESFNDVKSDHKIIAASFEL